MKTKIVVYYIKFQKSIFQIKYITYTNSSL